MNRRERCSSRSFLTVALIYAPLASAAPEGVGAGSVIQMIVGLVIVLAVLLVGAWMLRRFGKLPNSADSPLKIVTGISLGPRDRIVIVQVGGKQLLLGLSPGRIQTLHVLEEPIDVHTPGGGSGGLGKKFGELLAQQLRK